LFRDDAFSGAAYADRGPLWRENFTTGRDGEPWRAGAAGECRRLPGSESILLIVSLIPLCRGTARAATRDGHFPFPEN
jgi:hypothetical protein